MVISIKQVEKNISIVGILKDYYCALRYTTKYWGINTNAIWESHKMRVVYEEVIKPPSNSKCAECHGPLCQMPSRSKGTPCQRWNNHHPALA